MCDNHTKDKKCKIANFTYHQNYFTEDINENGSIECNKYSISLINNNGIYSIKNTGTKTFCHNYIICSKNFKQEDCLFLISNENLELKNLKLDTYLVAFAQVDKKNWVKSNSFVFESLSNSIIDINSQKFEEGATITGYNIFGGIVNLLTNRISFTLNIHNISDIDAYDIMCEVQYDRTLFILIPGIINSNFEITSDGRLIGIIPIGLKRRRILTLAINNISIISLYNSSEYQIQISTHLDFVFSSPTTNLINKIQSQNLIFTRVLN